MRKRRLTLISLTVLLLFATALLSLACEPGGEPIIDNQRNEEVRIYISIVRGDGTLDESIDYGVVPAQATKDIAGVAFLPRMVKRIEAKNPSGEVVFSHDYTMDDLEKIQWKITIPP